MNTESDQLSGPAIETWDPAEILNAILAASPVAIWALDNDGRVLFWNSAAERIFGWTKAEVLGKRTPVVPEDQQNDLQTLLDRYRRGETVSAMERRRRRKDGSPVDIAFWTAPLRDAAGFILGHVGIVLDVTERKRLEEQVCEAQKMEVIGRLAGGVAHDFNNLLTVMRGYGQLLLDDPEINGQQRQAVEEIVRAADRAGALTGHMLAFSRHQMLQPKVFDLNRLIRDTEKMLRRVVGEDVRLLLSLADEPALVHADLGQVEQVLMNLVINGRDAISGRGWIRVETAIIDLPLDNRAALGPGRYVLLTVSDTGCGMTAEVRQHIFEPFFTTKDVGKGTGLGLFTVYGIVRQAGGGVTVDSEPDQGTRFQIYWPAAISVQEAPASPASVPAPRGGTETILVAEDEEALRKLIRGVLDRGGYKVLAAPDGGQALRAAESYQGPIHLLLTDVIMPETTGGALAVALKAHRPEIKVLFISGYADDDLVMHGVSRQETGFLQKPFTPGDLMRKVREVLGDERQGQT